MVRQTIKAIEKELSGERALQNARGIAEFHRIPASEGYREAAAFCAGLLEKEHLDVQIHSYEAREGVSYLTQPLFREWNCSDALLELTEPESAILADFKADCLSIVQRSAAVDFFDRPLDIVLMDRGSDEEAYSELDLRGKLLFIAEPPHAFLPWAVKNKGAKGFITDYMSDIFVRQRSDQYDSRLYLSFFWFNEAEDTKTFCFVITPRMGDRLRKLCLDLAKAHESDPSGSAYPRARGFIKAVFKDGTIENVIATIPGVSDEEVIIVAHLCHGKACANDNASGCGGAVEVMKTLRGLIRRGELPSPKRSIKLLLVPEVIGTIAYAASNESRLGLMKAGICLDMIGRKQEGESGLVGIFGVPDSSASFVQDLAAYILDEYSRDVATFNIDSFVTPVNIRPLEYVGGSDHYVLCDPTMGIPTVLIMQWLDSNYHTSADKADQLDPKVLKKTCCIAAAYIYTLANLQSDDLPLIFGKLIERFTKKILEMITGFSQQNNPGDNLLHRIVYLKEVYIRGAKDCLRFFENDGREEIQDLVSRVAAHIEKCSDQLLTLFLPDTAKPDQFTLKGSGHEKYSCIPSRKLRGPVSFIGFKESLPHKLKSEYERLQCRYPSFFGLSSMNEFILHRVDGKRTILEIASTAAIEGKLFDPDYVYEYLLFLKKIGLVEFGGEPRGG